MAVQVSYPGVYIQEVSSGVRTITGVATSIAMFVGYTDRGPLSSPTLLLSFADYQRNFGDNTQISELATQVRLFFQNGGQRCYVMRIADGATAANVTAKDLGATADSVVFTGSQAGSMSNRVRADVTYSAANPEDAFSLRLFVEEELTPGTFSESSTEVFGDVDLIPGSGAFLPAVLDADGGLASASVIAAAGNAPQSISDRIIAGSLDSDLATQLLTTNQLRVIYNGAPPVLVTVPTGGASALADLATALTAATGATITATALSVGTGFEALQVEATDAAANSIQFVNASDPATDLGAFLGLGASRGGFETSRFADTRPAPTGIFWAYSADATEVLGFAEADPANYSQVVIVDSNGSHEIGFTFPTGARMTSPGIDSPTSFESFSNARARLDAIVSATSDHAVGKPEFVWRAQRNGFRLSFTAPSASIGANFAATSVSVTSGVSPTWAPTFGLNAKYYTFGLGGSPATFQTGAAGSNGAPPGVGDYDAAYVKIAADVDLFNILVLPKVADAMATSRRDLWGAASSFALASRAILLIDPPTEWKTISDVVSGGDSIEFLRQGVVKDHAAVYWPRVTQVDPNSGLPSNVDPSGTVAGLYARTDAARGVWKAPAGIEASLRAVTGLERRISDAENGIINPQAVNANRVFPNGLLTWGARTMDGFDNSGNDDYKYVPVRRLALFMEESLVRGLKFAVFEPNGEQLWGQIRLAAGAFMNNLFRQGAFAGNKTSDAYFVKCDSETTTQNDINLGIVNVLIGFAPLKPAEFVVISLQQIAGQVEV